MNVTLSESELLIIGAALTRINNDNRSRDCAVTREFEDLLIKVETAARNPQSGQSPSVPMNGIVSIAAERRRQIEVEGWAPEHDDQHTDETLALVAALYATPFRLFSQESSEDHVLFEDPWPSEWDDEWDKREELDRRRKLVISGALIAAEIDRLDRLSARSASTP